MSGAFEEGSRKLLRLTEALAMLACGDGDGDFVAGDSRNLLPIIEVVRSAPRTPFRWSGGV